MFRIIAALLIQLAAFTCFAGQSKLPPECPAAGATASGSQAPASCPDIDGASESTVGVSALTDRNEPDEGALRHHGPPPPATESIFRLPAISTGQSRAPLGLSIAGAPGTTEPSDFDPAKKEELIEPLKPKTGIRWGHVAAQSLFFLGIEHGFRLLDPNQPYTRAALKGPFFKDWFDTVKDLKGWTDSDEFIINYVGHPAQGAVSGRILIQNDPRSQYVEPGYNRDYGSACLKAFGFSFLYSLQFELGPISEASLGNSKGTPLYPHPTSYVDLVITPTVGTGWMIGEDLADRHLIAPLENKIRNRTLTLLIRTLSNPSRVMSNALRFKWPWYRDDRF